MTVVGYKYIHDWEAPFEDIIIVHSIRTAKIRKPQINET
jgi:hypothetical protein